MTAERRKVKHPIATHNRPPPRGPAEYGTTGGQKRAEAVEYQRKLG